MVRNRRPTASMNFRNGQKTASVKLVDCPMPKFSSLPVAPRPMPLPSTRCSISMRVSSVWAAVISTCMRPALWSSRNIRSSLCPTLMANWNRRCSTNTSTTICTTATRIMPYIQDWSTSPSLQSSAHSTVRRNSMPSTKFAKTMRYPSISTVPDLAMV